MSTERRPLLAANWKMNLLRQDARSFCTRLLGGLESVDGGVDLAIFPSFPLISAVAEALAGSAVAWGGQDIHPEDAGAFTGDVSGPQLADFGCSWALCGHSERRDVHGESDELVGRKAMAARKHGLKPLICIGETAEQRKAGQTFAVLERQLRAALATAPDRFALAYEPVWAIGTGETATPELAQEAHAHLRGLLAETLGEDRSRSVRLLYGGSAKPGNAAGLIAQPDIDGFLVGGASLDPDSFLGIMARCGS